MSVNKTLISWNALLPLEEQIYFSKKETEGIELDNPEARKSKVVLFRMHAKYALREQIEYARNDEPFRFGLSKVPRGRAPGNL